MGIWIAVISLTLTVLGSVITITTFIITMQGNIKANMTAIETLEKLHCQDMKYLEDKMEVQKEHTDGVFKEIKDELKSLHELMMQVIQKLPKREGE